MRGDEMQWAQWPADKPRPTEDEWNAAVARFKEESRRVRDEARYGGDTGVDLGFDMATCSIGSWWHYFFPGEAQ